MKQNVKSVTITSVLIKLIFVLMVLAIFAIPFVASMYDQTSGREPVATQLCVGMYLTLIPGFVITCSLNRVINNIKKNDVFIENTVKQLRIMSYCCFVVTAIFIYLGVYRQLALLVACAAGFIGLILRVLKNVFEKAIEIKEENDYTI
ncbi:MAG TPA: DUF2975 domain-containing protein [Clostridiales bacterium]|nr:DUF2975 domain-containing protein [Clostridiales bacterium]